MNPYTISGIVAGVVVGFFLGRKWAEHFRAEVDARRIRDTQKNYRGSSAAWYAGAVVIIGGAILFGYITPV